jgi:hypothetical protein
LPANNVLDLPSGSGIAASQGVWLMLRPLSTGQHTIHFTASIPGIFSLDITYNLTVGGGNVSASAEELESLVSFENLLALVQRNAR